MCVLYFSCLLGYFLVYWTDTGPGWVNSSAIIVFWLEELFRNLADSSFILVSTGTTHSFVLAEVCLVPIVKALEILCNDCVCQKRFYFMYPVLQH